MTLDYISDDDGNDGNAESNGSNESGDLLVLEHGISTGEAAEII